MLKGAEGGDTGEVWKECGSLRARKSQDRRSRNVNAGSDGMVSIYARNADPGPHDRRYRPSRGWSRAKENFDSTNHGY